MIQKKSWTLQMNNNTQNNPLVSIIIPTYKRGINFLDRAIKSVIYQTYTNIEIIVVDDNACSSLKVFRDNNEELLKKYPYISFLKNKTNMGGALSRNEGIKKSNGKFITFLDDDDIYLPKKIEHQVDFMVKNDLNCSFTDLSIYNENDELIDKRCRNDIKSFDKEYLIRYHLTKTISGTETFMISQKLLFDIGGFDDAIMGQEFYLMFKILNYPDLKIGYFESDDIKAYRTNSEAISTGPNKIKGEKIIYKFKKDHFYLLNKKEKRYVRCRHRAVMSVANLRNKRPMKALAYLFASFLTSPSIAISEATKLRKAKKQAKKINKQ